MDNGKLYIYIVNYLLFICNKNEIMIFAGKLRELGNVLSEVTQIQQDKCFMFLPMDLSSESVSLSIT